MGSQWPQDEAWNIGATSVVAAEPHNAAGEAIPAVELFFPAPAEASLTDESHVIALEKERWPEDTFPTEEAFPELNEK